MGGIAMKRLRALCLLLVLAFCLQTGICAVDSVSLGGDSLSGKTILILGDSYTAGYGLEDVTQDWPHLMAQQYGMTLLAYSISGSTITSGGYEPMSERCLDLPDDAAPDIVLLQGGSNDWLTNMPLGDPSDTQTDTFCGALNRTLDVLAEKYPSAFVVCFTPWLFDSTKNALGLVTQDYIDAMWSICGTRNVLCYNASNAKENGMSMDQQSFRDQYCLRTTDWYHLNPAGHALFAPIFGQWLETSLYGTAASPQFYDLGNLSEEIQNAVNTLTNQGVLSGTSTHLFSPTRPATRRDLALAMYRLAGSPAVSSDLTFQDVDGDSELYSAVAWAMEAGLFSESETFCPDQALTREMLSAVLFRDYTQVQLGFPTEMVGLGPYDDGDQVAQYARISLGWTLAQGILTDQGGLLRPKSTVSRSQLALALARFQSAE
jgi:lysophospholipase L1-like esterase